MADKWVKLDVLKYAIQKLQGLINKKADSVHKHFATDINEDNTHNFVSIIEKEKLGVITTNGKGDAVLHNDGTYKQLMGANTIDDVNISNTTTYSSNKINMALQKKSDANHVHNEITQLQEESHTHENKNVLDDISLERFGFWDEKTKKIITTGQGNMFLADNGEYKEISGVGSGEGGVSSWHDLTDKPFNEIDNTTLSINDKTKLLSVKRVVLTENEYNMLLLDNKIDDNTIYIITDDENNTNEMLRGHVHENKDILDGITEEDIKAWNSSDVINDIAPSASTTYSSDKIETRLEDVQNTISAGQNDAVKMWQKTYLNIKPNDALYINVTNDFSMDKCIVQTYKFIEGDENVVETLKNFDNSDETSFYYNPDGVTFDGSMYITDSYILNAKMNDDGFFESDIIDKSLFLNIDKIEVKLK